MKSHKLTILVSGLFLLAGCQPAPVASTDSSQHSETQPAVSLVDHTVQASCGECQFGMQGNACDLAVRIDGKDYFVDGVAMDDHGDAHSEDGMCNAIRDAKVTGEIKDGRFVATAFELLPLDKDASTDAHETH